MFDFYNISYQLGYLTEQDLYEACTWGCLSAQEYKTITGKEYISIA